jgi:hypothetical protein
MNGMVNSTLAERVNRELRDFLAYESAREGVDKTDPAAVAQAVGERAVQSVVGYILMNLAHVNETVDSLAIHRLIERHAASVRLVNVTPNSFTTARKVRPE